MSTSVELRAAFSPTTADRGATLESIGISVLRYALVLIFVLFGALKFTAAEAAGPSRCVMPPRPPLAAAWCVEDRTHVGVICVPEGSVNSSNCSTTGRNFLGRPCEAIC